MNDLIVAQWAEEVAATTAAEAAATVWAEAQAYYALVEALSPLVRAGNEEARATADRLMRAAARLGRVCTLAERAEDAASKRAARLRSRQEDALRGIEWA